MHNAPLSRFAIVTYFSVAAMMELLYLNETDLILRWIDYGASKLSWDGNLIE